MTRLFFGVEILVLAIICAAGCSKNGDNGSSDELVQPIESETIVGKTANEEPVPAKKTPIVSQLPDKGFYIPELTTEVCFTKSMLLEHGFENSNPRAGVYVKAMKEQDFQNTFGLQISQLGGVPNGGRSVYVSHAMVTSSPNSTEWKIIARRPTPFALLQGESNGPDDPTTVDSEGTNKAVTYEVRVVCGREDAKTEETDEVPL